MESESPMTEQEEFEFRDRLEKEQSQSEPQKPSFLENIGQDISSNYDAALRVAKGINSLPSDIYQTGKGMMNGQDFNQTPLGQDLTTVSGAITGMPEALYHQYASLTAEPFKHIPGKIGEDMRKGYPDNPYYDHPVNSALALLPLAGPASKALRSIPAVDEGLNSIGNSLRENVVAPNARRALGKFSSKVPVEQANKVGLEALDQGVIKNPITNPLSSSPKSMLGRATEINDSIGENIGSFLKGQSEGLDASKAMQELESVKGQFLNDPDIIRKVEAAKELIKMNSEGDRYLPASVKVIEGPPSSDIVPGKFRTIDGSVAEQPTLDMFTRLPKQENQSGYNLQRGSYVVGSNQETSLPGNRVIVQTGGKPINFTGIEKPEIMDFSKANKLKGLFQKKVNYNSDAATQQGGKAIAGNFRNSIDSQLEDLSNKLGNREGMDQFKADKKLFGSTSQMQDVLDKEVNRQGRNMPLSVPSIGIGMAETLRGGGLKGVLAGLSAEWVKRFGNATAATMVNDVAKVLQSGNIPSVPPVVGLAPAVSKVLSKTKAKEYFQQAGRDKNKARKMAENDGYIWEGKK